jgi:polar amino acid transport system substrate-binding protein
MRTIQERGRLLVGTYSDLKLFGFADPLQDNALVGFDIDVARRIAKAIFGDADRVQFVTLTSAQRIPLVVSGQVDMVVATMTITAKRKEEVDFSEVYFDAGQRVLVRRDNPAHGLQDLSGQRLCVVAGSTGADVAPRLNPHVTPVTVEQYTDCLVAFRKDEADAIVSDDVILAGLASQDPYAKIVGPAFTHEPYGIAVAKQHPEFTAFINGVLTEMKQRGEWAALYKKWLGNLGSTPEPPPGLYGP